MAKNLLSALQKRRAKGEEEGEHWMTCVPAIVAENDDPEFQNRIKVIIPVIDESAIHDEWVRRLAATPSTPGYGDYNPTSIGAEVMLFGMMAMQYALFYLPVYNETRIVPADFRDVTTAGFRWPGDYKSIVEANQFLRAGRLDIETDGVMNILARGGLFVNGKPF